MNLPFTSEKEQDGPAATSDQEGGLQGCVGAGPASEEDCFENEPIRGLSDLYFPQEDDESDVQDIADILLDMGKLTAAEHASLRQEQSAKPGSDVTTLLLNNSQINKDDILRARAQLYGMEFRDIQPDEVEKQAFQMLDIDFIKNSSICPIAVQADNLVVATSEPANLFAIEEVKRRTQMNLQVVACSPEAIEAVCNSFDEERIEYNLDDIISDMMDVEVIQDQTGELSEDLEKMAGESPVIKFVNYLVSNAIHEGASDIHIEPKQEFTRIRYRIDGTLFETMKAPLKMHSAVVSRVKIMSNLDISERRLPQDGKISVIVGGRAIDLRVSTLPTNRGEKVVIRVLDSKAMMRDLEQLGMEPAAMTSFKQQIMVPHGILLVTGPTDGR
jgi:type IV pilus assembly protein PilB